MRERKPAPATRGTVNTDVQWRHREANQTCQPIDAHSWASEVTLSTVARRQFSVPTSKGRDFASVPVRCTSMGQMPPTLTVNRPGDSFEQEADRMAAQVMTGDTDRHTPTITIAVDAGLTRAVIQSRSATLMRAAAPAPMSAPVGEAVLGEATAVGSGEAIGIGIGAFALNAVVALLALLWSEEIGPEDIGASTVDSAYAPDTTDENKFEFVPRTTRKERNALTGSAKADAERNAAKLRQCEEIYAHYKSLEERFKGCSALETEINNINTLERLQKIANLRSDYNRMLCDNYMRHSTDPSSTPTSQKIQEQFEGHVEKERERRQQIQFCEKVIARQRAHRLMQQGLDTRARNPSGPQVQRSARNVTAPLVAPPVVQEVISSPGQPLNGPALEFFESRFGADFSHVRVHTDARAAESADSVAALAYTVGNHITFARGQYQPDRETGRYLIAHELCHTLQQAGTVGTTFTDSPRPSKNASPRARAEVTS